MIGWASESKLGKGESKDIKVLGAGTVGRDQCSSGVKRFWDLRDYKIYFKITSFLCSESPMRTHPKGRSPSQGLSGFPARSASPPSFHVSSLFWGWGGEGFPGGSDGKESTCHAGDLGWEYLLEEGTATHSSILAWRVPMGRGAWTPMGSMESQRLRD